MKCQCSTNRKQLALLVGQDAAELPEVLRRSLTSCPHCREHYQQLCHSQAALEQVRLNAPVLLQKSLWPELAPRLTRKHTVKPLRFRDFQQKLVPIFSVSAACLAVLLLFWDIQPSNSRIYQTSASNGSSQYSLPLLAVGNQTGGNTARASRFDSDPRFLTSQEYQQQFAQPQARLQRDQQFLRPTSPFSAEDALMERFRAEFERELQRLHP